MKCPKCGGYGKLLKKEKGKSCYEVSLSFCDMCHGSGEVEVTNEEWLKSMNTEQFAEWIVSTNRCKTDHLCSVRRQKWCDKKYVVEWLKQPHKE